MLPGLVSFMRNGFAGGGFTHTAMAHDSTGSFQVSITLIPAREAHEENIDILIACDFSKCQSVSLNQELHWGMIQRSWRSISMDALGYEKLSTLKVADMIEVM